MAIFFISFSAYSAEWPKPNLADCSFYYELEKKFTCKAQGVSYLADYAPFYCEEFKKKSINWSAPLKSWTQKTRGCLQEMLYEHKSNPDLSCQNLEEIAFKTHSACYNEADLCQLKISDIYQVIKVVKFKDFFKEFHYSDGGMIRLINYCIKRHLFK